MIKRGISTSTMSIPSTLSIPSIVLFIIIIFIAILLILMLLVGNDNEYYRKFRLETLKVKELFKNNKFRAPPSLTSVKKLKSSQNNSSINANSKILTIDEIALKIAQITKGQKEPSEYKGNVLSFPDYFNCNEKWIGCLPRAMNQVNCGSCWAFAACTALSARFYIGSCGLSGCSNYPQINFESLNNVHDNINDVYKFNLMYLTDVFNVIDANKNKKINKDEWFLSIMKYYDEINNPNTSYRNLNGAYQILVYLLDFQSLGSIDLSSRTDVEERAFSTFNTWSELTKRKSKLTMKQSRIYTENEETNEPKDHGEIDLTVLLEYWANSPITLSTEKLITCCSECMELDFVADKDKRGIDNPACLGSTLNDAWTSLRSNGVPTASCIGYNLDSWTEGHPVPSCRETQGPFYGFCSGLNLNIFKNKGQKDWLPKINKIIDDMENSGIDPISIPHKSEHIWTEPQLFRFRAKNVYDILNNERAIQEEIMTRGPVTTGFTIRPDFQYDFGTDGMGGQLFDDTHVPLGSTKNSLIYTWNGSGIDMGGHAVVIVGWGTYKWTIQNKEQSSPKTILIPYWIVLNSWGTEWGHCGVPPDNDRTGKPESNGGGYFWILRGSNECEIENNITCGEPDLENITYPGIPQKYGWNVASPSITNKNIEFIEQSYKDVVLDENNKIVYKKATPGSGSYPDRIQDSSGNYEWLINYMNAPSPFTLFWPTERPTFKIGKLLKSISEDPYNVYIQVSFDTIENLEKIIKYQKNPLLTISNEQVQFIGFHIIGQIKISRAVNNSILSSHKVGTPINVIPFHELSIGVLKSIVK